MIHHKPAFLFAALPLLFLMVWGNTAEGYLRGGMSFYNAGGVCFQRKHMFSLDVPLYNFVIGGTYNWIDEVQGKTGTHNLTAWVGNVEYKKWTLKYCELFSLVKSPQEYLYSAFEIIHQTNFEIFEFHIKGGVIKSSSFLGCKGMAHFKFCDVYISLGDVDISERQIDIFPIGCGVSKQFDKSKMGLEIMQNILPVVEGQIKTFYWKGCFSYQLI